LALGRKSDSELFAAAPAARSQHAPAVLGCHALTETMYFVALTLFGLVGMEHFKHSF
jgi:hypothetical protein